MPACVASRAAAAVAVPARARATLTDLVEELGADEWADSVGVVPVASFTATKLRWLAEHEPDNAARTAAVCLPHDWLTGQILKQGRGV